MAPKEKFIFIICLMLAFVFGCKNKAKSEDYQPKVEAAEHFPPPSFDGPSGTVKGVVRIKGDIPEMPKLQMGSDPACADFNYKAQTVSSDPQGHLANAVVRVKAGSAPTQTSKAPILVNQVDCLYRPRVQIALSGQQIQISNSDKTFHNVHASKLQKGKRQSTDTILNKAQPAGNSVIEVPTLGEDVVKLKCDMHGWMSAFVVVSDNMFGAVSDSNGVFEFKAPVGELDIEAWHEYFGVQSMNVAVVENQTTEIEVEYQLAN